MLLWYTALGNWAQINIVQLACALVKSILKISSRGRKTYMQQSDLVYGTIFNVPPN